MRFALLIVALLATVFSHLTTAYLGQGFLECGNTRGTGQIKQYETENGALDINRFRANYTNRKLEGRDNFYTHLCPQYFVVPVLSADAEPLQYEQVANAIEHLEQSFLQSNVPVFFALQNINYRDDPYLADHVDHLQMVEDTRVGGFQSLNVYFVKTLRASHWGGRPGMKLHGMTSMPFDGSQWPLTPEQQKEDMIVLDYRIATGELMPKVGLNAIVHEAGHWMGLYHQYHNGCDPNKESGGDYVWDTPPSAWPMYDCPPRAVYTCGYAGEGFQEPADTLNYMDSTPNDCQVHFTSGQQSRMRTSFCLYRYGTEFKHNPPFYNVPDFLRNSQDFEISVHR
ncbi:uncharacterized protein J3D65DRAFT_675468 [Phyllosticta citribraziliensis]|uniref:Peptidase M43 pregnancy-associated plasma-A domain-containing protein n=1 Tax=Phyllosticta citribraziliensis TaxID=989973 RepID=A0ABR1LVW6_9PEZI